MSEANFDLSNGIKYVLALSQQKLKNRFVVHFKYILSGCRTEKKLGHINIRHKMFSSLFSFSVLQKRTKRKKANLQN